MSVREAFQNEYVQEFLGAEDSHARRLEMAFNNEGDQGFQWYGEEEGPALTHKFSRTTLDKEVARTTQTPERMAKIAADEIASKERAYRMRYRMTCLGQVVRARVRRDQMRLATQATRERLEAEMD